MEACSPQKLVLVAPRTRARPGLLGLPLTVLRRATSQLDPEPRYRMRQKVPSHPALLGLEPRFRVSGVGL